MTRVLFSQRNGYSPIPPQLSLGQISKEHRALLWHAVNSCIDRHTSRGYLLSSFTSVISSYHASVLHKMHTAMSSSADYHKQWMIKLFSDGKIEDIFDYLEYLLDNLFDPSLSEGITNSFIEAKSAYRIFDGVNITPVGTEEQGNSISRALTDTNGTAPGANSHLKNSAAELRAGNWAASVRESIHAVEALAVQLAPNRGTLGQALMVLAERGHIHGALKTAFERLYGYASDEQGVRHSLVLRDAAQVDEADALFMLGACASFVSYLIARSG